MENLKISGRLPEGLKREEARAWVHACRCILEFHKKSLSPDCKQYNSETGEHDDANTIMLFFQKRPMVEGEECGGWAMHQSRTIVVSNSAGRDSALQIILHEILHLYCVWDGGQEWPTSTLTHRLLPEVYKIYAALTNNVYKRAAWLAHGKLSYARTIEEDDYNPQQYESIKQEESA